MRARTLTDCSCHVEMRRLSNSDWCSALAPAAASTSGTVRASSSGQRNAARVSATCAICEDVILEAKVYDDANTNVVGFLNLEGGGVAVSGFLRKGSSGVSGGDVGKHPYPPGAGEGVRFLGKSLRLSPI